MKKIFKFALVALAAAAVVVSCNKPAAPQDEQTTGDDYTGPVQGTSDWSVIGALLDKNWDTDFVCAEENGAFVLKNVKLAKDNQIKFRKDKDWAVNRGINEPDKHAELAAGTPTKAIQGGGNIIIPADGIYDLYYFAEKEAIVYVAKGAALPEIPNFAEEPKGLIDIDGDFSDWAEIEAVTVGNHTFKFAKDDKNVYFYSERAKDEKFNDIWGSDEGYVYFGLDLDKNPETGDQTLWGNGPFEFVGVIWPYGGSAAAPVINKTPSAKYTSGAANLAVNCDGKIDENGVAIEFSVSASLFPAFPSDPFIVYSWGSTGLAKVEYHVGEPQPEPEAIIKIDGDLSDWDEIEGAENVEGAAYPEFKVTSDSKNIYFYTKRVHNSALWNAGGYLYYAFDLDNDATTGDGEIWGNGPYEIIFVIWPFAGTADAPAFAEKPLGESMVKPSGSLANYTANGKYDEDFVELEFSIPRADLPSIPESEITIYSWGNKSGENMKNNPLKITL